MSANKLYRDMGKIVTVHSVLNRRFDNDYRHWVEDRLGEPRPGWIVGYRTLHNGIYQGGWSGVSYDGEWDGEGPSLKVESVVKCVLVSFWLTQKPVHVPLNGYELGGEPYFWSKKDRQQMSDMCREHPEWYPRKNGKFVKEPVKA